MDNELLSVSEFSKITRTTRETLYHYDETGLLTPAYRGENKYRYYSIRQLALCNAIRLLIKIGLPLADIKEMIEKRTPELVEEKLTHQVDELSIRKEKLNQALVLLDTILQTIQSGKASVQDPIVIQSLPAENIMLGRLNDYSKGKTDYSALYDFYQDAQDICSDIEFDLQYPVWGFYSMERVKNRDFRYPDRYYFHNPKGKDQRPAGMYAIGYMRAGYGCNDILFKRMLDYIEQNGYEISGDAYEEYPLNEICISDDSNYLMRIIITVQEKK